ncbi:MAG TPA: dTDP-4-dehydrorhamnose reductase [Flavitalea sp.]|nr:dTDP-4-dehydrorhamnose reductase [Flavitalea sp.]
MSQQKILVTGANGQLGMEFRELAAKQKKYEFIFLSRDELPVDNVHLIQETFDRYRPDFCFNCAAYTAVDKAESEKEKAFAVNAAGVQNLAKACVHSNTRLVHFSTDYVFDGLSSVAYQETAPTNPVSVYGLSKLKGEALSLLNDPSVIIIRTAWVYSAYGHNFVKTMLRLMQERAEIKVVHDQIGSPTYAADLAAATCQIIDIAWQPGIYHFTNSGTASWFEFACAIRDSSGSSCKVMPIKTSEYPTAAKRPPFSLLDTRKIREQYDLNIPHWKESLERCLIKLKITN